MHRSIPPHQVGSHWLDTNNKEVVVQDLRPLDVGFTSTGKKKHRRKRYQYLVSTHTSHSSNSTNTSRWVDEAELIAMQGSASTPPPPPPPPPTTTTRKASSSSSPLPRSRSSVISAVLPSPSSSSPSSDHDHDSPPHDIRHVQFGSWLLDTWYASPYPSAYHTARLYVCDRCLKYTRSAAKLHKHQQQCRLHIQYSQPPGTLIYTQPHTPQRTDKQDDEEAEDNNNNDADNNNNMMTDSDEAVDHTPSLSIWCVDAAASASASAHLYCQCLCLFAKFFIEHKTVYYDVSPFLFYVLTCSDRQGHHSLCAYFSKEKHPAERNNLACIVTLPHRQKQGYGRMLIQLSYALSAGGPERPLSALASITYDSYWRYVIAEQISNNNRTFIPLNTLAENTGMNKADVLHTLTLLELPRVDHNAEVCVRVSAETRRRLQHYVKAENTKMQRRQQPLLDRSKLIAKPRASDDEEEE